ncbi:LLM class flavin-dependent oxidoreductase [Kutzneria kofuensis]|uniref:LLM class flavin-dependent oxidoreductase n=1 Tax=Kutzneria kofuensis TaxID=103725 RepID=UPI0031E8A98F
MLGERWTLLIVRELLLGPRRYSDLLADLPGLGTNLLADRLKFLVDKGVIRQCPGRTAYELTEAGGLLRPVVLDLTRWGFGFTPDKSTVDAVRPRWGFLAAETRLREDRAGDVDEDYEFHVDDEVFRFEVRDGRVQAAAGRAGSASVVATLDKQLTTPLTTWAGEWYEAVEARSAPGCVQSPRVPFVVAANGPRTMRLAARFGNGWVTTGGDRRDDVEQWWRSVAEASARMDDALAATDRRLGKLDRYLQADACPTFVLSSRALYEDTLGRAAELGFTDVVAPWPRHDGVYAGAEAVLEDVAAEVLPKLVT